MLKEFMNITDVGHLTGDLIMVKIRWFNCQKENKRLDIAAYLPINFMDFDLVNNKFRK